MKELSYPSNTASTIPNLRGKDMIEGGITNTSTQLIVFLALEALII